MGDKPNDRAWGPQASCATPVSAHQTTITRLIAGSIFALLLFALPALAQSTPRAIPENAKAKSYGDGWECDLGYRLNEGACEAVVLPENAYETRRAYGLGWDCLRGYRKTDDVSCIAISVPVGAFLDPSGERWRCLRGFRKVDETCQEVVLPTNAYLVEKSSGSQWMCERGFEAKGDDCVAIAVPVNGYLNTSGSGQAWKCERGFFKQGGACPAVAIPANAYLNDGASGKGWTCARGFTNAAMACVAIDMPANAHLDRSGNRWSCNKNFQRSKGLCLLNN